MASRDLGRVLRAYFGVSAPPLTIFLQLSIGLPYNRCSYSQIGAMCITSSKRASEPPSQHT